MSHFSPEYRTLLTSSTSGSEGEKRKRKRMESNRESARRSRQRKQKHLDDLTAQVAELRRKKAEITICVSSVTQRFIDVETENSALKARMAELTEALHYLNGILNFLDPHAACGGACSIETAEFQLHHADPGDGIIGSVGELPPTARFFNI